MVTANIEFEEACKVLGLDIRHASVNSINKAYRSLAKKYHPDKNPGVDPGLFVRITDAKNTALKHVKNNVCESSPPAKPLKLEIVPGEMEFKNVGRREIKCRDFIIYSVGGPFTKFTVDRKHLPKWIHISSVTRTTNQELPVRVTVSVTGPELGDQHECYIPIKIENKNTGCSEENGVLISLSMKEPRPHPGRKSFEFSAVNSIHQPNVYKEAIHADIPSKDGKARGRTASNKINIAKPPRQPLQQRKTGEMVKVNSRKAAVAITAAAGGLFLFSIICIANASPLSYPSTEPLQQETAQIEQPGKLQDTHTTIPAPAVQPETPDLNETQNDTTQQKANDPTDAAIIKLQPIVNQYLSPGYVNSDNIVSNLTFPAVPPVTTSESTGTQQNSSSTTTSGKTDTKPGPVNQAKKKDGKIRRPFQYVDIQGLRNRFDSAKIPGPPRLNRETDN